MSDDEIFQVIDGKPFHAGWRNTTICCSCNLVHNEIYTVRRNRKSGKQELWCKSTRDLKLTRKLRRNKNKKKRG